MKKNVEHIKLYNELHIIVQSKKQPLQPDFPPGEIEFGEFCQLCATFLVEDPDMETMQKELRDSFRLYDKEGQGFITMETLRGLICK